MTHQEDRAQRLRIASVLLAPRDNEGMVRAPLPADEAMARIRKLPALERSHLTGLINWVREFEENDTPERPGSGAAA